MMKVEVTIISKETVKPSLPTLHHLKPYKLTLFDQVTPATYVPTVFFYPMSTNLNLDMSQIIAQLKKSLSDTLNIFYPFSGSIKNNFLSMISTQVFPFRKLVLIVPCLSSLSTRKQTYWPYSFRIVPFARKQILL